MNWYITIAGLIGALATIGHFTMGTKQFLKPMLEASFDPVPKKVMHCVFHYVSTFMILSTINLLLIGLNVWPALNSMIVIKFIGANYLVFGVWQIILAASSDIPGGVIRLFQWIFLILIALFSFLGAYV
jgi:uncharacterized membrane protein HdeD (DUF308 family)